MHFTHEYPFDPSYGYSLDDLRAVAPPPEPADFAAFWTARYHRALGVVPNPRLRSSSDAHPRFLVHDLEYASTDGFPIRGWLLTPRDGPPRRGFVLGHGYGGIECPPLNLPRADGAYLVPCFRGLSRSRRPPISPDPNWHVLHDLDQRDRYILGGCVDDVWTGVSALLGIFPELAGHLGYLGISLGGGIGALALAWDARIARGHLNVPSFGHQPLRLRLPSTGSAAALQRYARTTGGVLDTLAYYDSAIAARHIRSPMQVAAAVFDPAVAPPGQFSVYNAIPGDKRLFVLEAGHFDYPGRARQEQQLLAELWAFFAPL
ncbi:acetylxylan esterase [Candidatus Thiodictyon syntrophicum]|jgi:cephalosporin-C deacetylase|uniref:Deacetylase n=1 Tax=Candidatus Thiodictyon syntrophicum TaxID=1166950 RepID=A0A2K8UIB1_9GAMM|nr:acetylxylan esterase [Candidatus Thiodictyon syntrophicum]AUB85275.1 deacetylase [Candidatus Thiodictyon syntrophicum]